jgi:two-component system, OmpR family, phosphate regulon sensor histidine kinase PhoR
MAQPDPSIDADVLFQQFMAAEERGLLVVGSGRRVLEMNPTARELLDYHGSLPRLSSEVTPDMNLGFALGDAFHDRRPVTYESYLPGPDRLLRYHIIPILARDGQAEMVVTTIEDVTRLRHLETVRRDFVANVSHELRTPLASMRLLVETLENGAIEDPPAAQHFLHRIDVEIDAMARLVEELLELSRLESGVLRLNIEPVDVPVAFDEVINRLAPMAREKEIELILDVQPGLPPVRADGPRLEQILMNLAHNAIKYTPEAGRVGLRARRQGLGIRIDVVDTGVGMRPEEAARVFERFYKVDRGRPRTAGSGLGLAIARHLVDVHGSRLTAVSDVGRGSTFSFVLPISQ